MILNECIICGRTIQGRKRRDARVCAGECAKKLALARTKAWKQQRTFSVKRGITPGVRDAVEEVV